MKHIYENRFGRLEIEVIGDYQDVTKMRSIDFHPTCFFTLDDADQIALITGNLGIQICFSRHEGTYRAALVRHQTNGLAALCRVVSLRFDPNINATKELAKPIPYRF